ncbi:MAG: thermosome subunit [Thermoplasmata archaeon]|nr:thermosome subunit [Thermoplasmata archaeon]
MLTGTPVILLREGTERATGKDALHENIAAARAVAESVRSTLGPRGMDKMMVDSLGDVVITNDGATILKTIEIQNPAGKMLAEVAKAQDQECGDGTKSSVILTGELLKRAEELLDERVHATLIVQGYRMAAEQAVKLLREIARPVRRSDTDLLKRIAMTSMMSKGVAGDRELLADLAVRAVDAAVEESGDRLVFDRKNVQIVKRNGEKISDSELLFGHVVQREPARQDMPKSVRNARIAILEAALEVKKTEFGSEIRITEPSQIQSFLDQEAKMLEVMANAVLAAGANVVLVEKGIADPVAQSLSKAGVYAVSRVPRKDLELIAKATGARLTDRAVDLSEAELGQAALVEERRFGEDRLTFLTGAPHARSVSLLIRGGTEHVVDEVERSIVDAISTVGLALEDGLVTTGAGAACAELALRLREYAGSVGGREQMAVRAFADALEIIPSTLAENAGMDTIGTLLELRRRHAEGDLHAGVDVLHGKVSDMREAAVEPLRVGLQILQGATETASMLLRIDDVISSKSSSPGGRGGHPKSRGIEE